jgi:hypothetical protein
LRAIVGSMRAKTHRTGMLALDGAMRSYLDGEAGPSCG